MKKHNDKSVQMNSCEACGMMSFPPLFKKEEKTTITANPAQNTTLGSANENSQHETMSCPGCGMMSFRPANR
ncbi:hypothetical protein EP47_08285 [Legionella norrlandica]|uniref:Uncharacterized protein n=1 Tax=Legionella norrlandica TaxID=1498499 RepID=A0A0A2T4T5_9GAMM|nr:hypothetical protein [Legionella norrlandica]KGP62403.1 hypothetical protein EP47_08285 [Legionella norrlandica]